MRHFIHENPLRILISLWKHWTMVNHTMWPLMQISTWSSNVTATTLAGPIKLRARLSQWVRKLFMSTHSMIFFLQMYTANFSNEFSTNSVHAHPFFSSFLHCLHLVESKRQLFSILIYIQTERLGDRIKYCRMGRRTNKD